jgi:hypothetical protein
VASGTKRAAPGELDAGSAAEIDKLFKANSVLGGKESDNCIALAKHATHRSSVFGSNRSTRMVTLACVTMPPPRPSSVSSRLSASVRGETL